MYNILKTLQRKKVTADETELMDCSNTELAQKLHSFIEMLIAEELQDLSLPIFFESTSIIKIRFFSLIATRKFFSRAIWVRWVWKLGRFTELSTETVWKSFRLRHITIESSSVRDGIRFEVPRKRKLWCKTKTFRVEWKRSYGLPLRL